MTRYSWKYPSEGTRFARSAREAFGRDVQFDPERHVVAPACIAAAVVFIVLIVAGVA